MHEIPHTYRMNMSDTFTVNCVTISDPSTDESLLMFQFPTFVGIAVAGSFVQLPSDFALSNEETLELQLIAAGLLGAEAEFASRALLSLSKNLLPQETAALTQQ